MTKLHEAFEDLAVDVPAHVVTDDLAAQTWQAGRRRRWHRRGTGLLLAIVIAALAWTAIPVLAPGWLPAAGDDRVSGYPQRIGHQWFVTELPDRPGPMAALLHEWNKDSPGPWYAISPEGRRWRIPTDNWQDEQPVLSPNGRYLGYLENRFGPYVIHDLVSGQKQLFREIGASANVVTTRLWLHSQTPGLWSPDNRHVLLWGGPRGDTGFVGGLLLGVDGSISLVSRPPGGVPAGWANNEQLVFVASERSTALDDPLKSVTVVVSGLDGSLVREQELRPGRPWRTGSIGQWGASVSPSGDRLAIVDESALLVLDLAGDAGLMAEQPIGGHRFDVCPISWVPDGPVLPRQESDGDEVVLRRPDQATLMRVNSLAEVSCVYVAPDAFAGEAFGLIPVGDGWNHPMLWWWREILGGLVVALLSGWVIYRRRRVTRSG